MNRGHVKKDFLSPNLPDWEMGVSIWNNRMVWGQVWSLHGFVLLAGPSPQESHVASSVQGIKIIKTMGMSGRRRKVTSRLNFAFSITCEVRRRLSTVALESEPGVLSRCSIRVSVFIPSPDRERGN